MTFCYFLTMNDRSTASVGQLEAVLTQLAEIRGIREVRAHSPASATDPMLDDGRPPSLVLQLFFADIKSMEAATLADGSIQTATAPLVDAIAANEISQQAMLARRFDVPEPVTPSAQSEPACTYLVRYEGPAQDTNAWLSEYLHGHPPLMLQLPGLRALEIFTRIDWCGAIPWSRSEDLQRNQVVFDTPHALSAALNSPLRVQMREHYDALPPFEGRVTHFPMQTRTKFPSST
jgi:hypothetical protein